MEKERISYWLGQRDMIANIFMWLRSDDTDEAMVIKNLATLYNNQFDGKIEQNPHVEHYLKNLKTNTKDI